MTKPTITRKPVKRLDLAKGEALFRAGLSFEAIAEKAGGVSKQAVAAAAKKLGWKRDLTQRVADAVDRKLTEVDAAVDEANAMGDGAIVEQAALARADVVVEHRKDIRKSRDLVNLLMGQLSDVATHRERLADLIAAETEDDPTGQRKAALNRAIALPTHAAVIRDLSGALKNLITLDRQAHNLDMGEGTGNKNKPAIAKSVYELTDDELVADIMARRAQAQGVDA